MTDALDLRPEAHRLLDALLDADDAGNVAGNREQLRIVIELIEARKAAARPAEIGAPPAGVAAGLQGGFAAPPPNDMDAFMGRLTEMLSRIYVQVADQMVERLRPALAMPAPVRANGGGTEDANRVEPARTESAERRA